MLILYRISFAQSLVLDNVPLDADDEGKLGLLLNIHAAILSAQSSESDLLTLCITVLLDVRLGTLEDGFALVLVGLPSAVSRGTPTLGKLLW